MHSFVAYALVLGWNDVNTCTMYNHVSNIEHTYELQTLQTKDLIVLRHAEVCLGVNARIHWVGNLLRERIDLLPGVENCTWISNA